MHEIFTYSHQIPVRQRIGHHPTNMFISYYIARPDYICLLMTFRTPVGLLTHDNQYCVAIGDS